MPPKRKHNNVEQEEESSSSGKKAKDKNSTGGKKEEKGEKGKKEKAEKGKKEEKSKRGKKEEESEKKEEKGEKDTASEDIQSSKTGKNIGQNTTLDPKRKVALITGITGQDGSYLAELLLSKGYEVHGIIRRSSSFNTGRIDHVYQDRHAGEAKFHLHYGDLTDPTNLTRIIHSIQPREIYNLGAQSHVAVSFEMADYTAMVDGVGTLRILEAIKSAGLQGYTRFYQASTSEMYGKVQEVPQSETTPFYPRSPYGCAKVYAYWICVNYREAYNMHISNGILFNHESPRRGPTFVTRKITRAVARIHKGMQKCLYLGNLDALRDWGHAKDYVEAMWLMLQQDKPDDYVIATGVMHSVKECVAEAFKVLGHKIKWEGKGVDEVGKDESGKVVVRVDPKYFRPTEVEQLQGNSKKAQKALGWKPETTFEQTIAEMVKADLEEAGQSHLKW